MKINLADSAGFCFGVKRAINMALESTRYGRPVEMLGDIVHNEQVVQQLERSGIRKVKALTAGENKILLIRAHGAGRAVYEAASGLGYAIIDATCPMVKGIHTITETWERRGYHIIVIGDRAHEEVQGILGHTGGGALVIDDPCAIPLEAIRGISKAAAVVQSTQIPEKVMLIADILKSSMRELKFFNTICKTTRVKQREMQHLPRENDAVIVIGSRTSANTQRLYEIAKLQNPQSYWVQSGDELDPSWLEGVGSIGVTAGASTPENTIRDVISRLRAYAPVCLWYGAFRTSAGSWRA